MKKIFIRGNKAGVSAVIGVILMVALTVSLTTTATYYISSNFGDAAQNMENAIPPTGTNKDDGTTPVYKPYQELPTDDDTGEVDAVKDHYTSTHFGGSGGSGGEVPAAHPKPLIQCSSDVFEQPFLDLFPLAQEISFDQSTDITSVKIGINVDRTKMTSTYANISVYIAEQIPIGKTIDGSYFIDPYGGTLNHSLISLDMIGFVPHKLSKIVTLSNKIDDPSNDQIIDGLNEFVFEVPVHLLGSGHYTVIITASSDLGVFSIYKYTQSVYSDGQAWSAISYHHDGEFHSGGIHRDVIVNSSTGELEDLGLWMTLSFNPGSDIQFEVYGVYL